MLISGVDHPLSIYVLNMKYAEVSVGTDHKEGNGMIEDMAGIHRGMDLFLIEFWTYFVNLKSTIELIVKTGMEVPDNIKGILNGQPGVLVEQTWEGMEKTGEVFQIKGKYALWFVDEKTLYVARHIMADMFLWSLDMEDLKMSRRSKIKSIVRATFMEEKEA